jgi:hypothetical protein
MQTIDSKVLYRTTPVKLLEYLKSKNIDLNSPIKINGWFFEVLPSILYAFQFNIDKLDYYKVFIDAGADVNIKLESYTETLFEDILQREQEDVLELFLPHFKLKYNKDIMYNAYLCLKNREYHTPKFIRLVEDLISKFDKKKWIKKLKQFQTDLRYTAKTAEEYPY